MEIEASHLVGVVIALLTYIAGRTELFGKCLRSIRKDLDVHLAVVKDREKHADTKTAI